MINLKNYFDPHLDWKSQSDILIRNIITWSNELGNNYNFVFSYKLHADVSKCIIT